MKIKLKIEDNKFDINLIFYNFLKKITQAKLSDNRINDFLGLYHTFKGNKIEDLKEIFFNYIAEKIPKNDAVYNLIVDIDEKNFSLFIFALKLNLIKGLLLAEAKLTKTIKTQELEGLNPLSIAYDSVSTKVAYSARISGALLSLIFFENIENKNFHFFLEDTQNFISNLAKMCIDLSKQGLEPNQIFMLLFSESIDQSTKSSAGANYEDRIKNILISMGINSEKIHDKQDKSTEFDFFFTHANRTYGIGAKRTLRERYKQFIKTSQMSKIDVMIQITLGNDLRPNIAESIRKHGVYIFVADEVYKQKIFLQEIEGIFPASELTLNLLENLS